MVFLHKAFRWPILIRHFWQEVKGNEKEKENWKDKAWKNLKVMNKVEVVQKKKQINNAKEKKIKT